MCMSYTWKGDDFNQIRKGVNKYHAKYNVPVKKIKTALSLIKNERI